MFFDRTAFTLGISRRANQSAQFHQRLVEKRTRIVLTQRRGARKAFCFLSFASLRLYVRNKLPGNFPEQLVSFFILWIFCDAKNPSQDANDISIENWRRLIEGNTANRS